MMYPVLASGRLDGVSCGTRDVAGRAQGPGSASGICTRHDVDSIPSSSQFISLYFTFCQWSSDIDISDLTMISHTVFISGSV